MCCLKQIYRHYVKIPLAERKVLRRKEDHDRGFNLGAGTLLRGEETPLSLESKVYRNEYTVFDYGMLAAAEKLIKLGVIKEDRF